MINSNKNYSPFLEHSFRRLHLLIQQQDDRTSSSRANDVERKQSSLLINDRQVDVQSITDVKPVRGGQHRTYMRPPKTRANSRFCRSKFQSSSCFCF